jgi:hypothetical protein
LPLRYSLTFYNVLYIVVCPSVLFWALHCLSFFDLRLLVIPLASSNFSYNIVLLMNMYIWKTIHDYLWYQLVHKWNTWLFVVPVST